MPPVAKSSSAKLQIWVKSFKNEFFTSNGTSILCQACNGMTVVAAKRSQLVQHTNSENHIHARKIYATSRRLIQVQIPPAQKVTDRCSFSKDLCHALLAADIPVFKLNNPTFRDFLGKYTGNIIPEESTIRKNYTKPAYEKVMDEIRSRIGDSCIWLAVDETTDAFGRYIGNVIIGKLSPGSSFRGYLIASKELESANHSTIANLVMESLRGFWPSLSLGDISKKFLILLTDGVAHMKKAAVALKLTNPKLVAVMCLAHGLNLVAEEIRDLYPKIDKLVSNVKKVFVKAPSRVKKYREMFPALPLPPKPVLTRWGTWLKAVEFYSTNFEAVKSVISTFDAKDAVSIANSVELFADPEVIAQPAFITANYASLPHSITKLENEGLSLFESISVVQRAGERIKNVNSVIGRKVALKFTNTMEKNGGFKVLQQISTILEGGSSVLPNDLTLTPSELTYFKYTPITTCDVERSFSAHKRILTDMRRKIKPEHLEWMTVVQDFYRTEDANDE